MAARPIGPLAVVDASVFGALAFNESRAAEAADMLGGITAAAPGLVRHEMANIARTKSLRHPDRAALIAQAFRRWLDLPVKLVSPEFDGVLALALARHLSAYDDAYLYLASAPDAPLLTFDERLASAWRDSA